MTRLSIDARALLDLDRLLAHLVEHAVADAGERIAGVMAAIDILDRHPMIGRPAPPALRELVIGKGSRGYLALYRYDAADDDHVLVLAIHAQRERGFAGSYGE